MSQTDSSNRKLPKRKPVRTRGENGCSSESPRIVVMGIDPGLASVGVSILSCAPVGMTVIEAKIIETKKATKKELRSTRVAVDDLRRMREIWDQIESLIATYQPKVIALEGYSPIPGQQGGGAWKTNAVTHVLVGLCWAKGFRPIMARPGDLRRMYLGKDKGSKLDIENVMLKRVVGAGEVLNRVAKSKREHVADAIGYATVGYEETKRLWAMMGMVS